MRKFKKLTMTLALLIMAVGGAWAGGTVYNSSVDVHTLQPDDILIEGAAITGISSSYAPKIVGYYMQSEDDEHYSKYNSTRALAGSDVQVTLLAGGVIEYLRTSSSSRYTYTPCDAEYNPLNAWIVTQIEDLGSGSYRVQITAYQYGPEVIELKPDETGKVWTLAEMPANDIELSVEYFDKGGVIENGVLPAENVLATTGQDLVVVSSEALTSNLDTLMYAISTSKTAAPTEGWTKKIPTTENLDFDEPTTIYVWYYAKGFDDPNGQNSHSDSDPAYVKVTVGASPIFTVSFAEGISDSDKWKADPNSGKKDTKVTVTYSGTKKVLGMNAAKKKTAPQLLTLNVGGDYPGTITYAEGETWGQAIQNHPTENTGWEIGGGGAVILNTYYVYLEDNRVRQGDAITPGLGYYTE